MCPLWACLNLLGFELCSIWIHWVQKGPAFICLRPAANNFHCRPKCCWYYVTPLQLLLPSWGQQQKCPPELEVFERAGGTGEGHEQFGLLECSTCFHLTTEIWLLQRHFLNLPVTSAQQWADTGRRIISSRTSPSHSQGIVQCSLETFL